MRYFQKMMTQGKSTTLNAKNFHLWYKHAKGFLKQKCRNIDIQS